MGPPRFYASRDHGDPEESRNVQKRSAVQFETSGGVEAMGRKSGSAELPVTDGRDRIQADSREEAARTGSLKLRNPDGKVRVSGVNTFEGNHEMNNSTAVSNVIPFRSARLLLVEKGGEPYIPMKPVVEGMGLDWKSQYSKLQGGRFKTTMVMITTVAEDGKLREMSCLPLKKLPGWLMSIHASKVRIDLRDGVTAYQNDCDDVLWAHWNKEIGRAHV